MSELRNNIAEIKDQLELGGGAQFWVYISPQNDTVQYVTQWEVQIEHSDGNWIGLITSENPKEILKTPNLSGIFNVRVTASGPKFAHRDLRIGSLAPFMKGQK